MFTKKKRKTYRRKKSIWSVLLALALAFGLFSLGQGRVIKVSDGDTISILSSEGRIERIRLEGIDSPELEQSGGAEAKEFCSSAAFLKEVKITDFGKDKYGRTVALVQLPDGRSLNEELIRSGHAWVFDKYCKQAWCTDWKALQRKAREKRLGLWKDTDPMPPWKWRQKHPDLSE